MSTITGEEHCTGITHGLINDIKAMIEEFQKLPDGAWDHLPDDAQREIIKQTDDLCKRTGEGKVVCTYNDPSTHSTF